MAIYFNTFYTSESSFLQIEKKIINKSFLKYFNFLILFISLLSLVFQYEEQIDESNRNITNSSIINVENPTRENFYNKNNKVILIEIINFIDEEDINDFIEEVKKELKNLNEYNASVTVKRSKFGVIKELSIKNIDDYNNLKSIFEKIQYDNNIIVTIE